MPRERKDQGPRISELETRQKQVGFQVRQHFLARTKWLGDEDASSTDTSVRKRLLLSRSSGRYSRTPADNCAFHLTVSNAFIPARH